MPSRTSFLCHPTVPESSGGLDLVEIGIDLARRHGVELRQRYRRLAKRAAIVVARYSHAHQLKRAWRALKFLRTRLGRVIRDIRRKIEGQPALAARF